MPPLPPCGFSAAGFSQFLLMWPCSPQLKHLILENLPSGASCTVATIALVVPLEALVPVVPDACVDPFSAFFPPWSSRCWILAVS